LLFAARDREGARAAALGLESYVPRDEAAWREAFAVLRQLGDLTRAQLVTRHFIEATGGTADARLWLVEVQILPHMPGRDRVVQDLADALAHPIDDAGFWRRVADLQRRLGEPKAALESLDHALHLDPDNFDGRCQRIEVLSRLDAYRQGRKYLQDAIAVTPETVDAWLRIAQIAVEVYDRTAALEAVDRAIPLLQPKNAWQRFKIAQLLLELEEGAKAAALMQQGIAITDDVWTIRRIFDVSYEHGLTEVALAAGEKLAQLGPIFDITIRMEGLRFTAKKQAAEAPEAARPASGLRGALKRLLGG
jgi:tetratricopeptide (TPR) repeat protein